MTLTSLIIKLITSDGTTWTAARERRHITYRGTKTRMAATSHEDQHRMKSVENTFHAQQETRASYKSIGGEETSLGEDKTKASADVKS